MKIVNIHILPFILLLIPMFIVVGCKSKSAEVDKNSLIVKRYPIPICLIV